MDAAHHEAFFDELDEADAVLLVAKAIAPELQSKTAWAELAGRVFRGDRKCELPDALRGREVARRQRAVAERGWVRVQADTWRTETVMDTDLALSVLQAAAELGRLKGDAQRVFGDRGRGRVYGWDLLRQARVQLALGECAEAMVSVCMPEFVSVARGAKHWPVELLGMTPQRAWLESAPDAVLVGYAKGIGLRCTEELRPLSGALVQMVLEVLQARSLPPARRLPIELLRGGVLSLEAARSEGLTTARGKSLGVGLRLLRAFACGDLSHCFDLGVALLGSHPTQMRGVVALGMLLSSLDAARRGVPGAGLRFDEVLAEAGGRWTNHDDVFALLRVFRNVELGVATTAQLQAELDAVFVGRPHLPWSAGLVGGLLTRWLPLGTPEDLQICVEAHARSAAGLRSAVLPRTFSALADRGGPVAAGATLLEVYEARAPWEHMLEQLEALADRLAPEGSGSVPPAPRIYWDILGHVEAPKLAPRLVRSPGTQGRALSIAEIADKYADLADERDAAVAAAWLLGAQRSEQGYGAAESSRRVATADEAALVALVGHPRVRGADGRGVLVSRGTPRIVVDGDVRGARMFVEPEGLQARAVAAEWESPTALLVYQADVSTQAVLIALEGTPGGQVPPEALERLLPVLPRLAGKMSLQATGALDLQGERVITRTDLEIDLHWQDPMLRLMVGCWPLGRHGPRCTPGEGPVEVVAQMQRTLRSTTRDLDAELAARDALFATCPLLPGLDVSDDGARLAYGLESSCWVLDALTRAAAAGAVTLAWPRGQPLRLSREYEAADFNVTVRREKGHWLRLEAELQVDEGEVVSWRLLAADGQEGRQFVQLQHGEVIRLSKSLRRKLDALARVRASWPTHADPEVLQLPGVALPALEGILGEGGGLRFAGALAPRRQAIEAALAKRSRIPRGLRASLRGYQREGFVWMSRLAHAGLGGVLADDMGLGKTVQALALLLERKRQGPALVVCPTSVVANWCAEAGRFAPSLTVVDVGALARVDRRRTLEGLGPGMLAVLSYGLMSRLGGDPLRVSTLVLDEAHALKNASSARTRAASRIVAEVRFGLTGTPIENDLGELWSVFNACVPGLLGDEDVFRRTSARAIQAGDAAAAAHLRALLRPFLLRRTKHKVLTELPERTEMLVMVEPGPRERAWYEAQRRLAQERVSGKRDRGPSRIKILAEISRLRRAAVEPQLVDDRAPRGAKLDLVVDRARELVAAGHQVLIFTQFLGVLAILGGLLEKRGVRTLEIQGATPGAERARRIDAFQAGEADVFLMSLKAGGVGVNLTAADYVIHVDPWWNPAVEDQATGRAHRMGQTRPVTVYRYCTQGSIEPKILALHEDKRELAQDVLGGMGTGKTLDLDELAALMR